MKIITIICLCLVSLCATAQSDLDFDMDVTSGGNVGGYAMLSYTVTNISTNTITNLVITNPQAVIPSLSLSPSTLAPGASITVTGRIAISGDDVGSLGFIFGSTQATVTGQKGSTSISELSDGKDANGFRVEDGPSFYIAGVPQMTGIIYVDEDLSGNYASNIDTIIAGAIINIGDQNGNTFSVSTNETGWWTADIPSNMINTAGNFIAVVDQSTFPTAIANYQLVSGISPFSLPFPLASNFEYAHGYTDGNSNYGLMRVTAFLDDNNNGTRDTAEIDMPYTNFEFIVDNDPSTSVTINNGTGIPAIKSDTNPGVQLNDINATLSRFNSFFNITTPNYDDILTTNGATTEIEFAITETASTNRDATLHLGNRTAPNPGFNSKVNLVLENSLNGTATGLVQFNNDSRASIISIKDRTGTDLLLNGTATANPSGFSMPYSLNDFEFEYYLITMSTPVTGVQLGDTFTHTASINPSSIDNDATNNNATLDVDVVASYDPNDVMEVRGTTVPINIFSNTDYLEYTIRFQNLGTAPAQFVKVLSTLDNQLDPATFEMIATSHAYSYEKNGSSLDFFFDNIQLQPKIVDEETSNGFITYRIKPLSTPIAGDIINASASIYFDYNAPVIADIWTTTFVIPASTEDFIEIKAFPNPLYGDILFLPSLENGSFKIFNMLGQQTAHGKFTNGEIKTDLNKGLYILKLLSNNKNYQVKIVKQ